MARLHRPLSTLLLTLLLPLASLPANAGDDIDDSTFEEDEDEEDKDAPEMKRVETKDAEQGDPDEEKTLTTPPTTGEGIDLDDEFELDQQKTLVGPGQDTARIYREQVDSMNNISADEEALAWERYLKKYPNSAFKDRIQDRMDELSESLYDDRIEGGPGARFTDAGKAEIKLAQPQLLQSIDPRNQLHVGFEMGLPNYIGFALDGEYQLTREWSVGGGIRSRYTGVNIEAGTHYALIKSARTNFILTGLGDIHLNVNPLHLGVRPQIGVGKRFTTNSELFIDAQAQAGSDILFVGGTVSPRLVGGANITVAPTKTVRFFFETSTYMKDMFWEEGNTFRFNVVTFGLKFITRKGAETDQFETGVGASAPYTTNYWAHHFGAITADTHFYY
jgi:hypothetical protein